MALKSFRLVLPPLLAIPALYLLAHGTFAADADAVRVPAAVVDLRPEPGLQKAVLAGGCFWGMQGVFEHVKGVRKVIAGYAGGARDTALYPQVSTGTTGHAESVEVTYDPAEVSYAALLRVYFSVAHNPTQVDSQGPDEGTQYRSTIFYGDADQKRVAAAYIAQIGKAHVFDRPVATRLEPLNGFYRAEAYHQDYLLAHPESPYIVFNDLPKIGNLKRLFPDSYAAQAATVGSGS